MSHISTWSFYWAIFILHERDISNKLAHLPEVEAIVVKERNYSLVEIPKRTLPIAHTKGIPISVQTPPASLPQVLPPILVWQKEEGSILLAQDDLDEWIQKFNQSTWPKEWPAIEFHAENEEALLWEIGQTLNLSKQHPVTALADMVATARLVGGGSIRSLGMTFGISKSKVDVYLTISRLPWWLRIQAFDRFAEPNHELLELLERALVDANFNLVQALLNSSGKRKDIRELNTKFKPPISGLGSGKWQQSPRRLGLDNQNARASRRVYYPGVQVTVEKERLELYLPKDEAYNRWLRMEIEGILEKGEAKFKPQSDKNQTEDS